MFLYKLYQLIFCIVPIFSYDNNQLQIGTWLSGAAYCDDYSKMQLSGPASGFIYDTTLHDPKTDLKGYTGILTSTKTIYIVLRGSSSLMNWLNDFEARLVPYDTFHDCNCNVHHGFYKSALGIVNQTIDSIIRLQHLYPHFTTILTAHSYGASCGQLLAMELIKQGYQLQVYNYGQPRVGDTNYADFVNKRLQLYRATHHKDIVPHVPPTTGLGYVHSCIEIYEDENGKLKTCNTCEDPTCSAQFDLRHTNITDHSYYIGHPIDCQKSTIYSQHQAVF
jgi:hypothetical protein